MAQYNAKEIEDFLSNNSGKKSIGDYYTTEVGCVLYEMENTTYEFLIESDNFYRSCIRYLIEKGQVKLNKQLQL
ncbi:hypothetical protein A7985_04115 [Pseudoalteromonas luteoviolacea]|uniref:Uncharacterized protein n=1 Tax=Pseudoalteromonas luteoviolacea TaxID=43657 RepID=A0A1C0TUZ6_9GAMM|nr:hypothetical protein A7985_04115 [Pseudoalteromonas luteoviolacea]